MVIFPGDLEIDSKRSKTGCLIMHQKILSVTRSHSQILQECMRVSFKFNHLICVFPQSVWNQVMIHDDAH